MDWRVIGAELSLPTCRLRACGPGILRGALSLFSAREAGLSTERYKSSSPAGPWVLRPTSSKYLSTKLSCVCTLKSRMALGLAA